MYYLHIDLDFSRIYDASYHSNDPLTQMASFTVVDSQVEVEGVNDLVNDIDNLTAGGGGDCPEYGIAAIIKIYD